MSGLFEYRRAVPVMLILMLLSMAFAVDSAARQVPQATTRAGYAIRDMAVHLRQTSDELTRMARLYAITGDPLYREYFQEILDIRNGEAPRPEGYFDIPYWDIVLASGERPTGDGETASLRGLIEDYNPPADEMALLAESEDQSNALAVLEQEVFEAVAAQVEAGGGDYVLEGDALTAMLRLHDAEYHDAKGNIMAPLIEIAALRRSRLRDLRDHSNEVLEQGRNFSGITLALAFLLGAGALVKARRS